MAGVHFGRGSMNQVVVGVRRESAAGESERNQRRSWRARNTRLAPGALIATVA